MANKCKFQKYQYKYSTDSGTTWNNVMPEIYRKGDLIEYDSLDCTDIEVVYRWRVLDGQYICIENYKYVKLILDESYDGGNIWYPAYPTTYSTGELIGYDEEFCNDKFVGYYDIILPQDCPEGYYWDGFECKRSLNSLCPPGYVWNGKGCVYSGGFTPNLRTRLDPIKVIKCFTQNETLTSEDTSYYIDEAILTSCTVGNCVTSIGISAFRNCSGLTSVVFEQDSQLTSIGASAFDRCSGLTSINIPSGVTSIGGYAFYRCSSLISIDIPSGVTYIYEHTFDRCSGLTRVNSDKDGVCNIPSGVIRIDESAFERCKSLTSVNIPSGVTSIGSYAFLECSNLSAITINATTPPDLRGDVFQGTHDCPLYVPADYVNTYKTNSDWSPYAWRIRAIP